MQDKVAEIIKVGEEMIREGGYNSFSFRQIADAVGIKSSSVHYHFATKEDLAVAVSQQYTDRFINNLGDPKELISRGRNPIEVYVDAFRMALIEDRRMCLCGMLAAEIEILPPKVSEQVKNFFNRNINWLENTYKVLGQGDRARDKAIQIVSLLEGAMITSNAVGDLSIFDSASEAALS